MELEPEQVELLGMMVEAQRSLPREERHRFLYSKAMGRGNNRLVHSALRPQPAVYEGDLDALVDAGLLRLGFGGRGTPTYDITSRGYAFYEQTKQSRAHRLEQVEEETRAYLESDRLPDTYADALAKWREADKLMWAADSERQATTIGHHCREAMQDFAQALVEQVGPANTEALPADPQKTVARIRACIKALRSEMGEAEAAWLDALLVYWGAVNDLAQRQEHGAGKEGQDLRWEDARRLVFQTAVMMYEFSRAAQRRAGRR